MDDHDENAVSLRGTVAAEPEEQQIAGGHRIVTVRLSVRRAATPMAEATGQVTDWVDCVAWARRQQATLGRWRVGDKVSVVGSLRRRFFRVRGSTATRVEVEVLQAQRHRRR